MGIGKIKDGISFNGFDRWIVGLSDRALKIWEWSCAIIIIAIVIGSGYLAVTQPMLENLTSKCEERILTLDSTIKVIQFDGSVKTLHLSEFAQLSIDRYWSAQAAGESLRIDTE